MRYGILSRQYISTSNWQDILPDRIVKSGTGSVTLENGILKCKSNSINESAYVYLPFVMSPGAMCEVQVLARRHSGTSDPNLAGGIAYNNYDSPQTYIGGTLQDINLIMTNEWQLYQHSFAGSPDKPYFALFLGAFTNSIGEFWFKDLKINWYGGDPDIPKYCRIYKDGLFKIDNKSTGVTNHGCTKVDTFSDYLRLHYTNNGYWTSPIIVTNVTTSKLGWQAHVGNTTRGYCDITIVNSSGQKVSPSTIPEPFSVNVVICG